MKKQKLKLKRKQALRLLDEVFNTYLQSLECELPHLLKRDERLAHSRTPKPGEISMIEEANYEFFSAVVRIVVPRQSSLMASEMGNIEILTKDLFEYAWDKAEPPYAHPKEQMSTIWNSLLHCWKVVRDEVKRLDGKKPKKLKSKIKL